MHTDQELPLARSRALGVSWMCRLLLAGLGMAGLAPAAAQAGGQADDGIACLSGAYRTPGDEAVAIRPLAGQDTYRYVYMDGRLGKLMRQSDGSFAAQPSWPGLGPEPLRLDKPVCGNHEVAVALSNGQVQHWIREPLRTTNVRFKSGGIELGGQLIEPLGRSGALPLMVFVHGSEMTPAVGANTHSLLAASEGIASFVFDKRGTGSSGGVYTQDFNLLAQDAAAAVEAARKAAGGHIGRIGLAGFSQGGWIAPRAAQLAKADFVVVGFGVLGDPLEQDAWQVAYELRQLGLGSDIDAAVKDITDVTAKVAQSDFKDHQDAGLKRLQDQYGQQPWFAKISGQYSGQVLRKEFAQAAIESPQVPWHYAALPVMQKLDIPQLWILGGSDSVAPSAPTFARLSQLQRAGKPIDIAIFPKADHGIYDYKVPGLGFEAGVRNPVGYYRMMMDWMNGKPRAAYGDAFMLGHR